MFKNIFCITIFNLILTLNSYSNEINITADTLEVDRDRKISIFTGNVHAHNEDIKIWSEILIVKLNQNESDIEEMSAENKVKIIRQNITATGQKAIYDVNSDVINMYENVEVFENENYVKCDELFLDIKNSISIMKSASSKRVEAFLSSN